MFITDNFSIFNFLKPCPTFVGSGDNFDKKYEKN